jgi:inner membrane protease subunit 1
MLPTMAESGEMVLNDRLTYTLFPSSLRRGDLLVFTSPLDPTRTVCKRIVGLPGDVVCVDPTGVFAPSTEHVIVPQGHVWVVGDNMAYSRDSRMYGPVPMGLIKGRLIARVSWNRQYTLYITEFSFVHRCYLGRIELGSGIP